MKNKTKETFANMRSLMERLETPMTLNEARINEERYINEASNKNRVQVTRDEFIDIANKANDEQNEKKIGKFATITYVNYSEIF